MDPITIGLLAGAALGTGKYFLSDKPREEAQRRLRAEEVRYSPWTKLQPSTQIQNADLFGNIAGTAGTGAMMGGSIQNLQASNALSQQALQNGNTPIIVSQAPQSKFGLDYSMNDVGAGVNGWNRFNRYQ